MSIIARDQSELTTPATKAAEWFIRYKDRDLTPAEQFDYLQWLKASPAHVQETLRAAHLYQTFSEAARPRGWLRRILDRMTGRRTLADALLEHSNPSTRVLIAPDSSPQRELLRETIVTRLWTPSREFPLEIVDPLWLTIIPRLQSDPQFMYQIPWRQWEEIVAAVYEREGFKVELTPRSNDGGRDVIASRDDLGTYRIYDQVKAFSPGHLVTANDVRAMLGVLAAEPNVSKAFITTTSDFAPGIYKDPRLVQFMPYRLQLRPRAALLDWVGRASDLKKTPLERFRC